MRPNHLLLLFLFLILLAGCEKDRVYEGIYEGMHKREQIVNPSDDPIPQEHQSYDEYKRDRDETLKQDGVVTEE